MKHNMQNAITSYDQQIEAGRREQLTSAHLRQLFDITTEGGAKRLDPAALAINALKAGYAIGYSAGRRR